MSDEYLNDHANEDLTPIEDQKPPALLLSNRTYDVLKPVATTVLPALQGLYVTLSALWGWGLEREISGTIAALNIFLGVLVGLSGRSYNKSDAKYSGVIQLEDDPANERVNAGFALTEANPKDLLKKDEIILKVLPKD